MLHAVSFKEECDKPNFSVESGSLTATIAETDLFGQVTPL
jgi:hypothetical protein